MVSTGLNEILVILAKNDKFKIHLSCHQMVTGKQGHPYRIKYFTYAACKVLFGLFRWFWQVKTYILPIGAKKLKSCPVLIKRGWPKSPRIWGPKLPRFFFRGHNIDLLLSVDHRDIKTSQG